MAIGEFGGAPASIGEFGGAPASGGPVLSNGHVLAVRGGPCGAAAGARARRCHAGSISRIRSIRSRTPPTARRMAAAAELFERSTRRYAKPEWGIESVLIGGERAPITYRDGVGAAVLPAAAFRAHVLPHAAPAAAEVADRRADVGPLRHAAARHGRSLPAQPRRLHHRLGRRAHGAAVGGPLRSRRLHRLRHQHAALPRRRHPCHRGVPAVGAGAGGDRADGSRRRSLRAALDHADGRPDRHAQQSDRGEQARRGARRRLVPPQRHHQGAVPASRLHARRLSGLPAAPRLRQHEPRPAMSTRTAICSSIWSRATAIRRRSIASSTTSISPSWI